MARALASSPVVVERPLEKKNLSGRSPRGVCTYFSFVTRLTVLSCMLITSATSRRVSGFKYSTPFSKKSRWRSTMKFITFSIVDRQRDFFEKGVEYLKPLTRSEEHTSEPQSQSNLVCRLLLEIK